MASRFIPSNVLFSSENYPNKVADIRLHLALNSEVKIMVIKAKITVIRKTDKRRGPSNF